MVAASSVLSKRHPHVDSFLWFHNAHNNLRKSLVFLNQDYPDEAPVLVYDHMDSLATTAKLVRMESENMYTHLCYSIAEFSLSVGRDAKLAKVVWVLPDDPAILRNKEFSHIAQHGRAFKVKNVQGEFTLNPITVQNLIHPKSCFFF